MLFDAKDARKQEIQEEKMSRKTTRFLRGGVPVTFLLAFAFALSGSFAGARQAPAKPAPAPKGKAFSSPEQAAEAVHSAAKKDDEATLMVIFGPDSKRYRGVGR